jgi:hypothetical protein
MDRALASGARGYGFESHWGRQTKKKVLRRFGGGPSFCLLFAEAFVLLNTGLRQSGTAFLDMWGFRLIV